MRHPLSAFTSTNLVVPFHTVPSPEWFEAALDGLSRFYRFVSLDEVAQYLAGERRFNSSCHVTFDDGHVSFREYAVPILRRRGIPATLFVSPRVVEERSNYWFQELTLYRESVGDQAIRSILAGHLGCPIDAIAPFPINSVLLCLPIADIRSVLQAVRERHRLDRSPPMNVTAEQLKELLSTDLIRAGAHTLDHPVLGNESDERARMEIDGSVKQLSALVGRPVTAFAYPNGTEGFDFGAREQALLREAGVTVAFSTDPGFFGQRTNPLAIPRGGCPSLEGESDLRIQSRVLLLPVWRRLSQLRSPLRKSEADEREEIRRLSPRCRRHAESWIT